ncbi:growth/differentiation factor 10b [Enoplosus armatus]|uniref:growth/differentiation factor 10b n=1 Tax=Enoplosus armatus TaxID=215367 RepID=UPI0039962C0E
MAVDSCHPVFFFLACMQAVTLAAHVKPPTNVTLQCRNMKNLLEWSYEPLLPELKFRIDYGSVSNFDINSSSNELWVEPPTLQADVSFLSDPNDAYFLTITAVIGPNESADTPPDGIVFSYFMDSPAKQKCFVDFPSVNVTAQQDNKVLFRFTHPGLLYPKLTGHPNPKNGEKKSHNALSSRKLPTFKYDVEIINQRKPSHRFYCVESVCEQTLSVNSTQEKHCLKIKGELQKIFVKAAQEYCALPLEQTPLEPNNYMYIYITMVSVFAVITITFVLFMAYRKKTKPQSSLPSSMAFTSRLKQWTLGVVRDPVVVPELGPKSPTPLLSTTEGKECPFDVPSPSEPDLRLRIGPLSTEDEGVCDVLEVENNEGSGYTQGNNLDEEETLYCSEPSSGYERRPVVVE